MEFEKAKKILNTESDKKYTDQEIIEIMQILEVFADVWVKNLLNSTKNEKRNSTKIRISGISKSKLNLTTTSEDFNRHKFPSQVELKLNIAIGNRKKDTFIN
jgi:hypothetical protein